MESGGSPNWSVCTGDGIEQSSGGGLILQVLLYFLSFQLFGSYSCYDAVDREFLSLPWTKLAYCGYVPENDKYVVYLC